MKSNWNASFVGAPEWSDGPTIDIRVPRLNAEGEETHAVLVKLPYYCQFHDFMAGVGIAARAATFMDQTLEEWLEDKGRFEDWGFEAE